MTSLPAFAATSALLVWAADPALARQSGPGSAPSATPPPPSTIEHPATDSEPSTGLEIMLGGGQLLAGSGAAVAAGLVSAFALGGTGGAGFLVLIAAAPPLVGGLVCKMGRLSPAYGGSCTPSILAAYVGALSTIPLAILVERIRPESMSDDNLWAGALIGGAIGWVVVQPLLATAAWHLWKKRSGGARIRPPSVAAGSLRTSLRLQAPASRRLGSTRLPGQVGIPLLAISW